MTDLSVIIVSYNTQDLLSTCLNSVFSNSKNVNIEVIVVDNNSSDRSVQFVKQEFPNVKVIQNSTNLGFAKANNLGIKAASGKYLLLLNSDTIILDDALTKMVNWMNNNSKAQVATCKLLNEDKSVQPTGGYFPTIKRIFFWQFFLDDIFPLLKAFHPKPSFYSKERELDWITGAFFLIRKEVIDRIGVLDEDFFMYAEELEYCFRIKKAGLRIFYTPITNIIHLGFKSGSKEKALIGEYESLKHYYTKHYPKYLVILARIILKLGALLRSVIISRSTYEKCFKVA